MTNLMRAFRGKTHQRLLVAGGLVLPVPAYAHHATGGQMPGTFGEGLLSGLAHPVIGLDHFLFLLVAAVLAYSLQSPSRYVSPALLVVGALMGTGFRFAEISVPSAEALISLSVIVGGGLVWRQRRAGPVALDLFLLGAGVLHGYAYAESIVGAESTPLVAYLIGLSLIQFCVLTGVMFCLDKLTALSNQAYAAGAERLIGGFAVLGGVIFLALTVA